MLLSMQQINSFGLEVEVFQTLFAIAFKIIIIALSLVTNHFS